MLNVRMKCPTCRLKHGGTRIRYNYRTGSHSVDSYCKKADMTVSISIAQTSKKRLSLNQIQRLGLIRVNPAHRTDADFLTSPTVGV